MLNIFNLLFCMASLSATTSILFPSQYALEEALKPFKEVQIPDISFAVDETVQIEKKTPLRNFGVGNLLKTAVYEGRNWTVYHPETPRVPHHLVLALNRPGADVTVEENRELFQTIHKISEICQTISINGFVIAQYSHPQQGHAGRYVVELIPHLPGFGEIKNVADKVDCNRYVLFRSANLTPTSHQIEDHTAFWQSAFQKETKPLDTTITFPYTRQEAHLEESHQILRRHLGELLSDKGAKVPEERPIDPVPAIKTATANKCFFCDEKIADYQTVYSYGDATIFYNTRKGVKSAANFLILPKRHTEKVYGLTESEIDHIYVLRKALVEVLKEMNPGWEIVIYTQDHPSVGQTVFHSHEQVVAIDPKTIAFTWTIQSLLYPNTGTVSNEEMEAVKKEVGQRVAKKLVLLEQAASF